MENSPGKNLVIEVAGVDVMTPRQEAILRDVNWQVNPGEYWVIGGPHGSGKSDFLMTAAGLRQPGKGTVRLFGENLAGLPENRALEQRTRIGYVFKGGGKMFTDLTVAENVALGLCYRRGWSVEQARDEVHALLEMTDLAEVARETAQTLRSDVQQRVGLARALALKPEVIFFDEPAAGLEARHREWWRAFMQRLSEQKMTVIAATNDFALWHGGNHRYALIRNGRCEFLGADGRNPVIE